MSKRLVAVLAAAVLTGLGGCSPAPAALAKPPTQAAVAPAPGGSERDFDLTAAPTTVELGPGVQLQAWTYNGTVPGPLIRVQLGDLVRVTLHNRLPEGTSIHWHGLAVPNGQDGAAGITQDAVPPGQTVIYSFVAGATGTYWYHSHQRGARQLDRGLYGVLIVDPRPLDFAGTDQALVFDEWPLGLERATPPPADSFEMVTYATYSVNGKSGAAIAPIRVAAGRPVRLRLVNAGYFTHYIDLDGAVPVIAAFDGHEVLGGPATPASLPLGPGERLDLVFPAPEHTIWIHLQDGLPPAESVLVAVVPEGLAVAPAPSGLAARVRAVLDLLSYSAVASSPVWPAGAQPGRSFTLRLTAILALPGGGGMSETGMVSPGGVRYEINGAVFPHTADLVVRRGDLVAITLVNQSKLDHPIHLHGHAFQVLSRNGLSPLGLLVKDTIVVHPRDSITIGFEADNRGWWMIHCHELYHSEGGMMAVLRYSGTARLAQLGGAFHSYPD